MSLILCVIFISIIAQTKMEFFFGVMFVSILGTIQSASRVMMTLLLNDDNVGKVLVYLLFQGELPHFLTFVSWNYDILIFATYWFAFMHYLVYFRFYFHDEG